MLAALLRVSSSRSRSLAGIALQLAYPGEFDYRLEDGGPALVTWFAVVGGAVALVLGLMRRQRSSGRRARRLGRGALRASGRDPRRLELEPVRARRREPADARTRRGAARGRAGGDVVYSDLETSYRIAAEAPVYIAAAPPGHVADTEKNRPYERRDGEQRFFRTGDVAIPRRAGADWLVVDRKRSTWSRRLDSVYRDGRYTLYVLP